MSDPLYVAGASMTLVTRFDTPGRLRDLPESSPFYDSWHQKVSGFLDSDISTTLIDTQFEPAPPNSGFYNASATDVRVVGSRPMVWMGLPREMLTAARSKGSLGSRREAFRQSDTRGGDSVPGGRTTQVEYLEWFTERDARGRITRVTFTTETPEYWETLFNAPGGPDRVLELYRELLGNPAITLPEITSASGAYDGLNVWNTARGIIHYIVVRGGQVNTFDGALVLATKASTKPVIPDNFHMDLGTTASDPRITIDGRALSRSGLHITAADPIGLYLAGWDDTGWSKPDGAPVGNYWRIVRPAGAAGPPALRLVYKVPPSEGFVVGDIRIGGRPIEFGGQIAEHLTVMYTALAGNLP